MAFRASGAVRKPGRGLRVAALFVDVAGVAGTFEGMPCSVFRSLPLRGRRGPGAAPGQSFRAQTSSADARGHGLMHVKALCSLGPPIATALRTSPCLGSPANATATAARLANTHALPCVCQQRAFYTGALPALLQPAWTLVCPLAAKRDAQAAALAPECSIMR